MYISYIPSCLLGQAGPPKQRNYNLTEFLGELLSEGIKHAKKIGKCCYIKQNMQVNKLDSCILGHGVVVIDCAPLSFVPEPICYE